VNPPGPHRRFEGATPRGTAPRGRLLARLPRVGDAAGARAAPAAARADLAPAPLAPPGARLPAAYDGSATFEVDSITAGFAGPVGRWAGPTVGVPAVESPWPLDHAPQLVEVAEPPAASPPPRQTEVLPDRVVAQGGQGVRRGLPAASRPSPFASAWGDRLFRAHEALAPLAGLIVTLALVVSGGLLYWLVLGPPRIGSEVDGEPLSDLAEIPWQWSSAGSVGPTDEGRAVARRASDAKFSINAGPPSAIDFSSSAPAPLGEGNVDEGNADPGVPTPPAVEASQPADARGSAADAVAVGTARASVPPAGGLSACDDELSPVTVELPGEYPSTPYPPYNFFLMTAPDVAAAPAASRN